MKKSLTEHDEAMRGLALVAAASQTNTADPRKIMDRARMYLLWIKDHERELALELVERYQNE